MCRAWLACRSPPWDRRCRLVLPAGCRDGRNTAERGERGFGADPVGSCVRLLEWFTGVREPNISPWRRHTFGDLTSALNLDQPPSTQPVQFPDVDREVIRANTTESAPPTGDPG